MRGVEMLDAAYRSAASGRGRAGVTPAVMAFLLDVIAPIFLLIGCGYLLGRRRSVDPAPLADVAIYICLPFLMFAALVRHPVTGEAAAQAFAWQVGMYVVSMPAIALVARLAGWDKPTRSAVTLSLPTVNIASYGVPVVLFAFGDEALAIVMLLFVYGNVTAASLGTYIAAGGRQSPLQAFKSIFRLPLIYAAALALAVNALAVPIPVSILDAADLIGKAGPILAIILLGVQGFAHPHPRSQLGGPVRRYWCQGSAGASDWHRPHAADRRAGRGARRAVAVLLPAYGYQRPHPHRAL